MKQELELCQPQTVIIGRRFPINTSILSGITRLDTKLENVIAMRVKYFNITLLDADMTPQLTNVLLGLFSTTLSSAIIQNNVLIDTTVNAANGNGTAVGTNCIGWTPRIAQSSTYNSTTDAVAAREPPLIKFGGPIHLSEFDWRIQGIEGDIPTSITHTYTVHIVLEFRSLCQCQYILHDTYY